ncbi:MAG: redoxin domain-containing protein [Bacteroidales bacterium]|jgi:peroxiredoxin|nr:redoxin domain-containing protein [Bacteroidales bacterium]
MTRYFIQFIFICLFVLIHTLSYALPTFLKGKVINGKGMVIRISVFSDQISYNEKLLDIDEINDSEDFELAFEIVDIQKLFVRIGNQSFSFFAEEGKSYQLQIDNAEIPPKSAISEQKPLHLLWNEKNALNEAIDNFNYTFSVFLEENFIEIYKYRNVKLLQSFEKEIHEKLSNTSSLTPREQIFFKNFIAYKLAELKIASRTASDLKLGETYLKNKAVRYDNPSYMLFFNQYFSQYFVTGKRNTNYHDFIDLIKSGANVSSLLNYISKDPILEQARLRELVLLNALKVAYFNKDFNPKQVAALIQAISKSSKFPKHQEIGSTILSLLTKMQIGTPAPKFKLKSTDGIVKSLEDYKGRYVYMVFMSDNCQACESDFALIEGLHEEYKLDIAVLGILVNYTKNGLSKFSSEAKTSWDRLLFNNNFELLNNYNVRTYPLYILLDRDGNVLLYPAKNPHEGIDRYFDFIIKRDRDKNKKPDILYRLVN